MAKKLSLSFILEEMLEEGPVSAIADMGRNLAGTAADYGVPGASIGQQALSDNDYLAALQLGATAVGLPLAMPALMTIFNKARGGDPQAIKQASQLAQKGMAAKKQASSPRQQASQQAPQQQPQQPKMLPPGQSTPQVAPTQQMPALAATQQMPGAAPTQQMPSPVQRRRVKKQ